MIKELRDKLDELKKKASDIRSMFGMEEKRKVISNLEKASNKSDFWNDSQKASRIMQELEETKKELLEAEETENKINDLEETLNLAEEDSSFAKASMEETKKEIKGLEEKINQLETRTLFSEVYDRNDVILSIYSGAGGADAQDWSEMLLGMYLKWAEKSGFRAKILNETRGQEAGIKNATLEISGVHAYGKMKSEAGVHRLVRLSPYNADNLRQTSFALVEVLPVIEEIKEVEIKPQDIRVDVFRSSGAGGQSVNTTDSAVRITHLPTNTVVTCQNERSQLQNKEQAMKILRAKIHQKYLEEKEAEKKKIRGEQASAEWGSQIRSYVIHPYKLVKDHRTKHETANVEDVFGGNLEGFIEAYLRWNKK
ncbi:MAG TPA: peptide chain release factor 2 [Candidatus Moranbacteria bacterium]|nr:peptide chain release factor 2 [Candidatus Moranbacteria bacterium]